MKTKIIMALLALVPLMGVAQNMMDSQGRRQGKWVKMDKNNRKIYEGTFKDGLEIGTFTYYYSDGTVRMKNTFLVDGKFCSHEAYDKNGKLMATGFYNQKNRDSVWNIFNAEGKLLKSETYKMGTKTGKSVLFSSTGDTIEIQYWNDNKKHGYWYRKVLNGYLTGNYANNLLDGKYAEYRNNKVVSEGNYSQGLRDGQWKFYDGNNLEVVEKWNNGNLHDRKVLIYTEQPQMISTDEIAYFYPKGRNTIVITMDGTTMVDQENSHKLFEKVGEENFVILNNEKQLVAAYRCIVGFEKDEDGKEYVELSPKLSFNLYPDDNCRKLVESILRQGLEK
jgi:antitoxin component YwqK of YwqJK toxin-antitoxin module